MLLDLNDPRGLKHPAKAAWALGGSIAPVHNPVNVAELAISKGATTLQVPVLARNQLNDMVTNVNILFYTDAREAVLKAIVE